MSSLLYIALGPVQDFIATARRTRDLWFGSFLLSELSKAVARALHEQERDCLIFPAPLSDDDLKADRPDALNVANVILANVGGEPEALAKGAIERANEQLYELFGAVAGRLEGIDKLGRTVAAEQIGDLLEIYWACTPLESDYPAARARVVALVAARKATRDFVQPTWGSAAPKSSLDGQREAVLSATEFRGASSAVRTGEFLSGVDLLKRFGRRGQEDRFFSTSHVAALPLIERLDDPARRAETTQAFELYRDKLRQSGIRSDAFYRTPGATFDVFRSYDGHLLFEERLTEDFGEVGADTYEAEHGVMHAQAALAAFLKGLGLPRPHPYYALLLADGDRMGKALDQLRSPEAHRDLSQTLAAFAGAVKGIVASHAGNLVYAGGDDVLAFLPLHQVLACSRALADDFRARLSGYQVVEAGQALSPTLSVGVAIVHHLEPLSDALTLVRRAEREAKKERNALCCMLARRGDEPRVVRGSWSAPEGSNQVGTLYERLQLFSQWHVQDAFPDGAAYELQVLARDLGSADVTSADVKNIVRDESTRILRRKRTGGGNLALAEEVIHTLRGMIGDEQGPGLEQIAQEIIIARDLAVAQQIATGANA